MIVTNQLLILIQTLEKTTLVLNADSDSHSIGNELRR